MIKAEFSLVPTIIDAFPLYSSTNLPNLNFYCDTYECEKCLSRCISLLIRFLNEMLINGLEYSISSFSKH